MIRGGGCTLLSRNNINPQHIQHLLDAALPVSVDYRLCPETTILNGPMADVCSALHWARTSLPSLLLRHPIPLNNEKVVVVSWSTGGHLAMSLAWTAPLRGIKAPGVVLALYCPPDFKDAAKEKYDLLEGVQEMPTTAYNAPVNQRPLGVWLAPADPHSRIVLDMNWKVHFLPIVLNGLPPKKRCTTLDLTMPSKERIMAISPYAQILKGTYSTLTFIIHGPQDALIPWQQSQRVYDALVDRGVIAEIAIVEGAKYLFDLFGGKDKKSLKAV